VPLFAYKGLNAAGKGVSGVQEAESPKALGATLKGKGIFLTEVREESPAKAGGAGAKGSGGAGAAGGGGGGGGLAARISQGLGREVRLLEPRIKAADVALLTQQLSTLVGAGLPLVESLNALVEQTEHPRLRLIIQQVREDVMQGTSLADALGRHKHFQGLYANMVRAGEASGTLDVVLQRLADFTEAQADLRAKVLGALLYPALLAGAGALMLSLLLTVVVPKITQIFADMEAALPIYTRILIFVSDVLSSYWWLLLALLALGTWLFMRWKAQPAGRVKWDRFTLKVPVFGDLLRTVAIARFARTLSTLLRSGVPILTAMDITKHVLGNVVLEKVIEDSTVAVREGEGLASPLKRSGEFPPMIIHMVAIGEKSGQLEEMLANVAKAYESRVGTRVTMLMRTLEPLTILILGGMVGFVVFSILMPLLKINEFAQ
jgi:general secretion pathway protein F